MLLALCEWNPPIGDGFPSNNADFSSFIDDSLHRLLDKHSRGWWFETPRRSCDGNLMHSCRSYIHDLINVYGYKYLRTISHWKYAINLTIYISSLRTFMSILTILWLSTYFIANRIVDILRWFRSQIFQCLRRLPSAHIGFYCIYLKSWHSRPLYWITIIKISTSCFSVIK